MKIKIFRRIGAWFKKVFDKEFHFLKKNSKMAVEVTNVLKGLVESPITAAVVNLTPITWDNELLFKARPIVRKVAIEMAIAHGIIQTAENNSNVFAAIIDHLKQFVADGRVGFWVEFSGRLNVAFSDGKISLAEGISLAQMIFEEMQQNQYAAAA